MGPIQLVPFLWAALITFHLVGVYLAISKLRATIAVEKLAKSYKLDYSIKNKTVMYLVCILFSWFAYSALRRLNKGEELKKK